MRMATVERRVQRDARELEMPQPDTLSSIRALLEDQNQSAQKILQGDAAAKVITRNHDSFLTERPEKSKLDYQRRTGHRHTGFNSLTHVPYRPFADLKHTDAHSLITESMGLPSQRIHIHESPSGSDRECIKTLSFANQHTIRIVRDSGDGKKSKLQSRAAGLTAIHLHINSSSRAAREVAAGTAYHQALSREEERRHFLQRMRAPRRLKSNSNGSYNRPVHNPSIYLPLLLSTASSKTCLTSWRPHLNSHSVVTEHQESSYGSFVLDDKKEEEEDKDESNVCRRTGPNIYVAVAAGHFKFNCHIGRGKNKEISPAKKLQMRNSLVKVKAIYSILCSIYNIKMKELKDKRPLTMDAIKQMSLKPLPNKDSVHHNVHRLGGHMYTSLTPSYHLQTHRPTTGHAVETWEDLTAVHRSSIPSDHMTTPTPQPLKQQSSASPENHHHNHLKIPRILPPWQRQLVFVDTNENSIGDPAVVIAECIQGFQSAKDQISEQTKSLLSRYVKNSTHTLAIKARELKLGANTKCCLNDMREMAYNLSRTERASEEKNRPAWYGVLEKEVKAVFDSRAVTYCHESNARRVAAKWLMERMKYFLCTEVETIPRVLEKLCLVVMSLPADQLCLKPVIDSIQFVLEDILEVPSRLCQQWLEMRGVSAASVPLPQRPVIVFGLTV